MDHAGTPSRHLTFATVALGTFMSTLDASVVNVALPTLARELNAGLGRVEWVVLSYLLALATLLLNVGRVADLVGRGRLYAGGLLIFGLSSAACAASTTVGLLVAARVVQGVGGAIMNAVGPAILTEAYPPEQRGRVLGVAGLAVSAGLAAGPSIGGFLLAALSWHWIFLINVPIGLFGALVALKTVPAQRSETRQRMDIPGSLLLGGALGAMLLALAHATKVEPVRIVGLAAVALVLGGIFLRRELRSETPVVDLHLFRNRTFTGSAVAGFLIFVTVGAVNLVMPFYLTEAQGLPPRELGLVLTALPLVLAVVSPLSGWLTDRLGSTRGIAAAGGLFASCALLIIAGVAGTASPGGIAACLGGLGLAVGTFQSPNNTALMGAVPRERLGTAGGLLATVRVTGMLVGNQVGATAFSAAGGAVQGLRVAAIFGAVAGLGAIVASLARGTGTTRGARRLARSAA